MSLELDVPASGAARQGALLPPFACSCRNGGLDAAWVHVGGELDIATTRRLERTLDGVQGAAGCARSARACVLRQLRLHGIIGAGVRARRAGRRLVLVRVPSHVDRMLTLTGSSDQVEIGDVDPVAPPVHALQRSLVARSLLMADKTRRGREPVH